jgi:hypothetical protein
MAKVDKDAEYVAHQLSNGIKVGRAVGGIIISLAIIGFVTFIIWAETSTSTTNGKMSLASTQASPKPSDPLISKGVFTDAKGVTYAYLLMHQGSDVRYAATFKPSLPHDDGTMVLAMLELLKNQYGPKARVNPSPTLVPRNGVNLVAFQGENITYYFLINKEDSGEISAMTYWAE